MNISSINSISDARRAFASEADAAGAGTGAADKQSKEIATAAKQFEAIILRQLLSPSIEPLMSNGIGGGSSSNGGGVYGYMLTDAMANSLSQGGGLGLSRMLEKQLTPKGGVGAAQVAAAYTTGRMNNNE